MISYAGTPADPVVIGPLDDIVNVGWGGAPYTVVQVLRFLNEHVLFSVSSSRITLNEFADTAFWLVAFDSGVAAIVEITDTNNNDSQLTPLDPSDAAVPGQGLTDNFFDPASSPQPAWGLGGSGYDFTKPVTLKPTTLVSVQIDEPGDGTLTMVNQLFNSQVTGDPGYKTWQELYNEINQGTVTATVTAYQGGTFTITPFGSGAGVVNNGGTQLWANSVSRACMSTGELLKFNKAGPI